MDWLTIAIIGILFVILLIVLWEKHQMQKEAELFASQVEDWRNGSSALRRSGWPDADVRHTS